MNTIGRIKNAPERKTQNGLSAVKAGGGAGPQPQAKSVAGDKPGRGKLTGAEFMDLWRNTDLRQYVIDEARRRNKLPQLQEEYVQEAWMYISCAPAGYDIAAYRELAYRAIYSAWWQTRKEYILMRSMDQHAGAQMCKTLEAETDNEPSFMAGDDRRRQ